MTEGVEYCTVLYFVRDYRMYQETYFYFYFFKKGIEIYELYVY